MDLVKIRIHIGADSLCLLCICNPDAFYVPSGYNKSVRATPIAQINNSAEKNTCYELEDHIQQGLRIFTPADEE
jgi:hypothetical protein